MGYLIFFFVAFLIVSFCIGYSILWISGSSLVRKPKQQINPYIDYHTKRQMNDKNYEEYLKWMDKNNYGLPVNKVLTEEEFKYKKMLEKNL